MINQNTPAKIQGTVTVSDNVKVEIVCIDKDRFQLIDQNNVTLDVFNDELGFYTLQSTNDMVNHLKVRIKNEEMINILNLFRENHIKEEDLFEVEYIDDVEDYDDEDYSDSDEIYVRDYHEVDEDDDDFY